MKAIRTKYHGATNTKGSRISASDEDGNRVSIPYPHELSGGAVHRAAADALCQKMGWGGELVGGGLKDGYVFVFTPDKRVEGAPIVRQVEMTEEDVEKAERIAARLGWEQTAYTSSSALWGLFCLPENPATWKGSKRALEAGCIIKTKEFGFLVVQDLEDLHLSDVA